MKFEHLVEINDPLNPLIEPLTRTQLWRGLVLRAEAPGLFISYLDGCQLTARTPESVERTLQYGEIAIRDRVAFLPEHQVRYEIPAQTDIAASRLTVQIEEPVEGALHVRFTYEDDTDEAAGSMDAFYNEFRHSAYQEADIDTVRLIRQFAAEGRFD